MGSTKLRAIHGYGLESSLRTNRVGAEASQDRKSRFLVLLMMVKLCTYHFVDGVRI